MFKNYLISTGGSGGHVLPATTFYEHLSEEANVILSTDKRGLKYLEKNNKTFIINTPKLNNYFLLPFSFFKILFLTVKSFFLLKKNNISILISTGGYMSLPLCLAAKILGIHIFLIEPNMVIGRANKFFLNFSQNLICYSKNLINLPSGISHKLITINPLIRKEYYKASTYQKNDNLFTIIIKLNGKRKKLFNFGVLIIMI